MVYLIVSLLTYHGATFTTVPMTSMAACVKAGEIVKRQHERNDALNNINVTYSCVRSRL